MKKLVLQLLVGVLGCFVLVWGEIKHYVESHPQIVNTFQLEAKKAQPLVYYNYQVAYDPNNDKLWYYYGDGFWYDKPPQIRKRENQNQKALGVSNGPQGGSSGHHNGQQAQASTHTTRY